MMNRSRCAHSGSLGRTRRTVPYSAARISADENTEPMCAPPAREIISSEESRMSCASLRNSGVVNSVGPATISGTTPNDLRGTRRRRRHQWRPAGRHIYQRSLCPGFAKHGSDPTERFPAGYAVEYRGQDEADVEPGGMRCNVVQSHAALPGPDDLGIAPVGVG